MRILESIFDLFFKEREMVFTEKYEQRSAKIGGTDKGTVSLTIYKNGNTFLLVFVGTYRQLGISETVQGKLNLQLFSYQFEDDHLAEFIKILFDVVSALAHFRNIVLEFTEST